MSLDPGWQGLVDDFLERARWKWEDAMLALAKLAEDLTDYDDTRSDAWIIECQMPSTVTSRVVTPTTLHSNECVVVFESEPPVLWHERIVPWGYDL